MYYPCGENKGADQLCSYCTADLRLCFRICKLLTFPCGGPIVVTVDAFPDLLKCRSHFPILGLMCSK